MRRPIIGQTLVNHAYPGNVGELVNTIRASVAKAYLRDPAADPVELHLYDLPSFLLQSGTANGELMEYDDGKMIDTRQMMKQKYFDTMLYTFNKGLIDQYLKGAIPVKELSRIASAVQASTTMAIDAMFKQMKADGVDVIGFGAGEPDFNTPDNIKAAGIAAIEQNITRYTPAAGTVELRQAVCGRMKADYGLEYKPSQVVVSSGAKHLVYLALRAVVNPGDEVILPAPYWVSYIELIKMVGGVPVVVTATEAEHFKLTAEKLSAV